MLSGSAGSKGSRFEFSELMSFLDSDFFFFFWGGGVSGLSFVRINDRSRA